MNDPPTALVGLRKEGRAILCRLSMNDPPTALVGFAEGISPFLCRLGMNNPPTALVGCAPERRVGQRGESPLRANALRPEAKSNCVTERWGGKQQEANAQSVGRRTRFGLVEGESQHPNGEA